MLEPLDTPGIDEFRAEVAKVPQIAIGKNESVPIIATSSAVQKDPHVLSRHTVDVHLRPYDAVFQKDVKAGAIIPH